MYMYISSSFNIISVNTLIASFVKSFQDSRLLATWMMELVLPGNCYICTYINITKRRSALANLLTNG